MSSVAVDASLDVDVTEVRVVVDAEKLDLRVKNGMFMAVVVGDVVAVVVDDLRGSRVITLTYLEEYLPFIAALHGIISISTVPVDNETVPTAITY